ncbi:DUF6279 family lipoprotein [Ferrimonas pelagia]|uniref:DUF6279 family lipoprotein n=1 Tax=Ferrimonas pelagia TaxID=1177826 RepID=A0ABP9EHC7_9GAMM
MYNWLDWLIPWELDDYVSLSRAQERQLDEMIEQALAWHKANELPRYVQHIEALQSDVAEPLQAAQIQGHFDRSNGHWDRLFEHLIPALIPFIQSFSDAQIDEALANMAKDEAELREEYAELTLEQRIAKSNKSMEQSIRKKIGRLSKQQKAIIHDYNHNRHSTLALWLSYRDVWFERFSLALYQRSDGAALERELRLLMVEPDQLKSAQYLTLIEQNRRQLSQGFAAIHQSMSSKQQRRLNKELGKLRADFIYLAQP